MKGIEQVFKVLILKKINLYQFNRFKKEYSNIYNSVIETLNEMGNKNIDLGKSVLLLDKPNISKLNLKINVQKNFIFCGCFILNKKRVVLLEKIETFGSYYLEDNNIARQLVNMRISEKIGLIKNENGINITIHQSNNDLFSN